MLTFADDIGLHAGHMIRVLIDTVDVGLCTHCRFSHSALNTFRDLQILQRLPLALRNFNDDNILLFCFILMSFFLFVLLLLFLFLLLLLFLLVFVFVSYLSNS